MQSTSPAGSSSRTSDVSGGGTASGAVASGASAAVIAAPGASGHAAPMHAAASGASTSTTAPSMAGTSDRAASRTDARVTNGSPSTSAPQDELRNVSHAGNPATGRSVFEPSRVAGTASSKGLSGEPGKAEKPADKAKKKQQRRLDAKTAKKDKDKSGPKDAGSTAKTAGEKPRDAGARSDQLKRPASDDRRVDDDGIAHFNVGGGDTGENTD